MPAYMPAQKRQDIREAIQAGMTSEDIQELLHTGAGSVIKIKREMGIAIRPMRQTRTRGPVKTVAQVVQRNGITFLPDPTAPPAPTKAVARVAAQVVPETDIAELAQQTLAFLRAEVPPTPPVPTAPASPEAYVEAFENRVLEYRTILAQKNSTIERLKKELATLRDEYAQTVFRQQNWQGPTSVMNQSLGNGG